MTTGGMICNILISCQASKAILSLSPQQFERLHCFCYLLEELMILALEMASSVMICILSCMNVGGDIKKLLRAMQYYYMQ
jgi:hypothetical protein